MKVKSLIYSAFQSIELAFNAKRGSHAWESATYTHIFALPQTQSGATLVETAVGLPFFLALLIGIIDLSIVLGQFVKFEQSAFAETRMLARSSCETSEQEAVPSIEIRENEVKERLNTASRIFFSRMTIDTVNIELNDELMVLNEELSTLELTVKGRLSCAVCKLISLGVIQDFEINRTFKVPLEHKECEWMIS